MFDADLVVLHEHPDWQKPLFAVLEKRGIRFLPFDLKRNAFEPSALPSAPLYFNQASPSAYTRGNDRAVPFALALMRSLTLRGARVLNGAEVFAFELSKSAQAAFMHELGIDAPRTVVFNDVDALRGRTDLPFPALLKPEQGGSGARMYRVDSVDELDALLEANPHLWEPDKLLLLQEYFEHDTHEHGVVRMEFVGGELLYAMRVVSHGRFNLCPSEVCNPVEGVDGACALPQDEEAPPVEFFPYPEVPPEAVETGLRIVRTAGMDVAGIEYLETADGRRIFYDVNANSNLRGPIGEAFGFDPFERVADFLEREMRAE